jgi:hypothetical protein
MSSNDPIKPDGAENKGDSPANAVGGNEIVNSPPRAGDVPVDPAGHPSPKTGEIDRPTQPSQQDILDRIKGGEKWMIVFTAIVALTTVAQFIQSGCNNRSTSRQVNRIIGAADIQACAAKSFATSAANINTGIGTAVGELNLQADRLNASAQQTTRLAKAAEEANANVIASDRPWIGAAFGVDGFVAGRTPTYMVVFTNSGRRPARVTLTQTISVAKDYGGRPVYNAYDVAPSISVTVPGQPLTSVWKEIDPSFNPITEQLLKLLTEGTTPFRVYANIEYTDIRTNGKYWTHACWRYTPKQSPNNIGFSNCAEYNDAQ